MAATRPPNFAYQELSWVFNAGHFGGTPKQILQEDYFRIRQAGEIGRATVAIVCAQSGYEYPEFLSHFQCTAGYFDLRTDIGNGKDEIFWGYYFVFFAWRAFGGFGIGAGVMNYYTNRIILINCKLGGI